MSNNWQPMSTAPHDPNQEILASDYDSIKIIHCGQHGGWETRDGDWYFPSVWLLRLEVPPLPNGP